MSAETPRITRAELAKRLADPETYVCGTDDVMGKERDVATCICALCAAVRVFHHRSNNSSPEVGVTEKEKEESANLGHAEKETPAKELTYTASRPQKESSSAATPSSYASSSFSPSDDPDAAAFFGRRQTRKMYGQNPDMFTPVGGLSRRHRQE
jgi:hypothetical protein